MDNLQLVALPRFPRPFHPFTGYGDRVHGLPYGANYDGNLSVAFGDGHVELMPYDELNRMVIDQTGKPLAHWWASRRDPMKDEDDTES